MRRAISPFADLAALSRLVRLMRREQFDVVHAGTPKGGLLGTIAAWICRVPTRVYHVRGLPIATTRGIKRLLLSATERIAVAASTRVIAVSDSLRAEMEANRLCASTDVRVIGAGSSNGVDAHVRFNRTLLDPSDLASLRTRYDLSPANVVIGFVGRFTPEKGIAELLSAWRTVRSSHANVRLLVVGFEDDNSSVASDTLAGLRSDPRVHLHGGDWNTTPLYGLMDMLVLPTYREGFPNVLLEAAAMSLPVVATAVAGCVDAVIDGQTGFIVPPRDSIALAAAMQRYVDDAELRRAHGAAARTRVLEHFEQSIIWNGLRELYETGDVQRATTSASPASARQAA
jgi:glycosyltransferase involved in cell wall biosynthesis